MQKRDESILAKLREDSRKSLSDIGKELNIPVSTVFDSVKRLKKKGIVKRYTAVLDYLKTGYGHMASVMIRIDKSDKSKAVEYLRKCSSVNNLYEANDGYILIAEVIHKNLKEYVEFKEALTTKFKIKEMNENIILDDIKRESFMTQ